MAAVNTTPTANGVKSHSQTLDHMASYPLIADALKMYQQNSLGAKSISMFHNLYDHLAAPVLPYLQTPISVVEPYLSKVDSIGDSTLTSVDDRFPAVKSTDLSTLNDYLHQLIGFPFKVVVEGRDYVLETYQDEYKKTGGEGVVTTGKAVVSTELRIVSKAMHKIADFLGPQKEKLEKELDGLKKKAEEKLGEAQKKGEKASEKTKREVNGAVKSN